MSSGFMPVIVTSYKSVYKISLGFSGDSDSKESACKAEDAGDAHSIPGSGRSPGEGNGHPLWYSCLGNLMDRGACWATVQGVTKESDTS